MKVIIKLRCKGVLNDLDQETADIQEIDYCKIEEPIFLIMRIIDGYILANAKISSKLISHTYFKLKIYDYEEIARFLIPNNTDYTSEHITTFHAHLSNRSKFCETCNKLGGYPLHATPSKSNAIVTYNRLILETDEQIKIKISQTIDQLKDKQLKISEQLEDIKNCELYKTVYNEREVTDDPRLICF